MMTLCYVAPRSLHAGGHISEVSLATIYVQHGLTVLGVGGKASNGSNMCVV